MALGITLRPFQERAVVEYRRAWNLGTSHIGIAATAFGKTIFAAFMAHRLCPQGWRVIMLAHREALVAQNAAKTTMVDPDLHVAKEIADERIERVDGIDFISASIATLRGERAERCARAWKADGRKILLITDEAHHCLAETYQNFFNLLKPDRHLGLTATPFRGDGENLRTIFPHVAFNIERGEMVDDGWLARPHQFCVQTSVSLRDVKTRNGDYAVGELAKAIDVLDRNMLVVNSANEAAELLAEEHKQNVARAVCFAISVEHAHSMADLFREHGWEAYAIDGKTPIPERRHADDRLRHAGSKVVLCSCGVLTEGWDVEEVNLGLFARPTKSAVLCEQMMGRCLRWKEDKPSVLIVDFQDQYSEGRQTLAKPWHLPDLWDCAGGDIRRDELWFLEQLAQVNLSQQSNMWTCVSRREVEKLVADKENKKGRTLDRSYLWWDLGEEFRMVTNQGSIVLKRAPQGDLVAEWRRGQEIVVVASGMDLDAVCNESEMWLDVNFSDDSRWLRQRERYDVPSEKQLAYLKRLGIPFSEGITKHQASILINENQMKTNRSVEAGVVTFGKWKGYHITEVPAHYLRWALSPEQEGGMSRRPDYAMFQQEAERRGIEIEGASSDWDRESLNDNPSADRP